MCWTPTVSFAFGLFHLFVAFLVWRKKNTFYIQFVGFCLFFACMEFLQGFQWIVGTPNRCTSTNTFLTVGAYFLVWTQPLLVTWIGWKSFEKDSYLHGYYTCLFRINCILLFFGVWNLMASFFLHEGEHIPDTNFMYPTCTLKGDYGHLDWKWGIYSVDFQPNWAIYWANILTAFFAYPRHLQQTVACGWILSFLVTIFWVGGSEVASFWCLLSVFADLPILVKTYFFLPQTKFYKFRERVQRTLDPLLGNPLPSPWRSPNVGPCPTRSIVCE
jgi:hypothetical protein